MHARAFRHESHPTHHLNLKEGLLQVVVSRRKNMHLNYHRNFTGNLEAKKQSFKKTQYITQYVTQLATNYALNAFCFSLEACT